MNLTAETMHVWKHGHSYVTCRACGAGRTAARDQETCPLAVERITRRCGEAYTKLIDPLRAVARQLGYAVAVHGSLERDIDLIACPWTEAAVDARELAEAIRAEAERVCGFAAMRDSEANHPHFQQGAPGSKPLGRLVWTFHLGGGPYIDLSVMPKKNLRYVMGGLGECARLEAEDQ